MEWPKSSARRLLEARISELLAERVETRAHYEGLLAQARADLDEARHELAGLTDRVLSRQGFGKPAPVPESTKKTTEDIPIYEPLADAQARISALEADGKVHIVNGQLVIDS